MKKGFKFIVICLIIISILSLVLYSKVINKTVFGVISDFIIDVTSGNFEISFGKKEEKVEIIEEPKVEETEEVQEDITQTLLVNNNMYAYELEQISNAFNNMEIIQGYREASSEYELICSVTENGLEIDDFCKFIVNEEGVIEVDFSTNIFKELLSASLDDVEYVHAVYSKFIIDAVSIAYGREEGQTTKTMESDEIYSYAIEDGLEIVEDDEAKMIMRINIFTPLKLI